MWLEDNLELSDSLKIIVPEDELTLTFAGGEDAKCIWLKKLSHYSALCFDPEATDENSDTESNENNFSNERSTTYLFSKAHKLYPGATYIGSWDGTGQIAGQGTLLYPDGSRLLSEFLEGLAHGCGVYSFGGISDSSSGDSEPFITLYNGVYRNVYTLSLLMLHYV